MNAGLLKVNGNAAADAFALVGVTAVTRFAFRSHYLYDIDSVNFALALRRFDTGVHQPQPPGYFLYICLGRVFNRAFENANTALVAISILFSCAAVAAIYALAHDWFGRMPAMFAAGVFVFSPLAWFHGTVALAYIVECFFSALTGFLCWRIYCGRRRFILPASLVVGIAAGFRPSSLLLLGPLLLFSLHGAGVRRAAAGIAMLVLTLLAWFVPMIRIEGAEAYWSSLVSLWLVAPSKTTVFNSPPASSLVRVVVIGAIYLLCFGCAAILPFLRDPRTPASDHRKAVFTWIWIAPGLLFFALIFLKFVNSGYLLLLAPPICAWMGQWAADVYARLRLRPTLKLSAVAACVALNTAIFLGAPFYCSYGQVRQFEAELESTVRELPQTVSCGDTMIVGFDSHFLGYRHAGYYLPGCLTVQFPPVGLAAGNRIFAMEDRNTWLETRLDTTLVRNFVLFPLPADDSEYSEYMDQVRRRFPPGVLRTVAHGGREFVTGPVEDLRFLFPSPGGGE